MNRPAAIAAVLALFIVGVVVGVLATHMFYARQLARPGGPPRLASGLYAGILERSLELSSEQRAEIDEILGRSHQRAYELRREMGPRVRELMEATTDEIASVLTPEQREEFERMRRDRHRRGLERLFLGPGGRGGSRGPRHGPSSEDGP